MYIPTVFAIVYFVLTALDIVTTRIGLKNPGLIEGNKIMALIVHNLPMLIIAKFVGFVVVVGLLNYLYVRSPKLAILSILLITIVYLVTICSNVLFIISTNNS